MPDISHGRLKAVIGPGYHSETCRWESDFVSFIVAGVIFGSGTMAIGIGRRHCAKTMRQPARNEYLLAMMGGQSYRSLLPIGRGTNARLPRSITSSAAEM